MALSKPTVGQTSWGATLNTALDYLDTNTVKASARATIVSNSAVDITLALTDAGTLIRVEADENNYWQGFKVPANSDVAFPIGTVITFAVINSTIICTELDSTDEATRSNIYGEGQGTSTNWMGFNGTGICRLIKIGTNDWMLTGPSIFQD